MTFSLSSSIYHISSLPLPLAHPHPHPHHPLDLSKPPPVEDDQVQLTDQDGFFGHFCLMCAERCEGGGDAYCSPNCQLDDALRASAASASTPTPILSWASPSSSFFLPPTPSYPFPIILIEPNTLSSSKLFIPSSPQLPSTPNIHPSHSISSSSLLSTCSSSDLSSLASLSLSSSRTPINPSSHLPSSASRPPPSPSIKATLARSSLSPSITLSSSGTSGHAALALRQALGISFSPQRPLTLLPPFKKTFSSPSSSNWFKSLVKRSSHPRA